MKKLSTFKFYFILLVLNMLRSRSAPSPSTSASSNHNSNHDPYDLDRFCSEQRNDYARALNEIRNGSKRSCWMWYCLPTAPWVVNGVERGSWFSPHLILIRKWRVDSVKDMKNMFRDTNSFNIDLSSWIVSSVTNMDYMFYSATAYTHTLCGNTWVESDASS